MRAGAVTSRDWRLIAAVGCAVLSASCDLLNGGLGVAMVPHDVSPEHFFFVPETVQVDEPFEVVVRTVGACGDRKGKTFVATQERAAVIAPLDWHDGTCLLDILLIFEHRATLRFAAIGDAQVTLRARRSGQDLELTETVVVR